MKTGRPYVYGKYALFGLMGLVLVSFVAMWLWNWLVPLLFNGPVLTYWQVLGLLFLAKILFSGFPGRHRYRPAYYTHAGWEMRDRWRKKFEEKMNGVHEGEDSHGHGEGHGHGPYGRYGHPGHGRPHWHRGYWCYEDHGGEKEGGAGPEDREGKKEKGGNPDQGGNEGKEGKE